MTLPRREVLIIATGGQGEPRAALGRIADGKHPIKLDAGDTVIFSSKQIPGNEIAIGRIQNQLAAKGVEMVTERQAHVHVSGHPGRPELDAMYDWIRPEMLVPVHGEMRHMMEQARFGLSRGHAARRSSRRMATSSASRPSGPKKIGDAPVGRLVLDGDVILPADGATMNERRRARDATARSSVAVAIDGNDRLRRRARGRAQGVPVEEDRDGLPRRGLRRRGRGGAQAASGDDRTSCARRCASPCAASRPTGPARSRWSTC